MTTLTPTIPTITPELRSAARHEVAAVLPVQTTQDVQRLLTATVNNRAGEMRQLLAACDRPQFEELLSAEGALFPARCTADNRALVGHEMPAVDDILRVYGVSQNGTFGQVVSAVRKALGLA